MELKDYQEGVLERLSLYLKTLKEKKQDSLVLAKFRKENKKPVDWTSGEFNFCGRAWEGMNDKRLIPLIPRKILDKDKARLIPKSQEMTLADYKNRFSGMNRAVPNICLKVPTGGGKTLLGAGAIEQINTDFFEQNRGFVLWVVPSDSIYKQTLKALSDRESLYRQTLDRASLGRVKILQKTDSFHPQDIKDYLCVMILMLQSAGRKTKETLRMFKDSGKFPYFFPEIDDYPANKKLIDLCPNLEHHNLALDQNNLSVKQSLGNVLRLVQPLIVIDEGHRAYTEKAKNALLDFNPRFILELSATPNTKVHHSNVLISVSGNELKKEEMIKLPINIFNLESKDWKKALAKGFEIQQNLSKDAKKIQTKENRYIRPIMLVRVERTGTDQREKKFIHSEDAKEYLIKNLNADTDEVRIKSSSKDELGNEDLLSEYSRVKYIITKEALKEGWDCPFAYVLVILSNTKTPVAIEQMIGRILRQPHTRKTGLESLNQSYVICMDQEVKGAVEAVRRGLQNEGMDGLGGDIQFLEDNKQKLKKEVKIKRRQPFRGLKIFLPKVLYRSGKQLRPLSYERDLLYSIEWSKLKINKDTVFSNNSPDITHTKIDIKEQMELIASYQGKNEELSEDTDMDFAFMCQRLSDIIPNPWSAGLTVRKALSYLKRKNETKNIWANRFHILDSIRNKLQDQISKETEEIFREKIKRNEIVFKLVSAGDPKLNWEMAETLNLSVSEENDFLRARHNKDLQLSLFEDVYTEEFKFNQLEKQVAWYLDENSAIKWWHRIIEKQDWHLQGWQKNKIYPDFLVCLKSSKTGTANFSILETKGEDLKGNPDTEYKKKLFDLFTEYSKQSTPVGSIEIQDQKMTFDLIFQSEWREALNKMFKVG